MGTPSWATYFDGIEPDYPGRPREDHLYGFCPQQTPDTRKRKQGMVFPEDAFKLQDLENIPSETGSNLTSGSWKRNSSVFSYGSPLQSPTYSSSSGVSEFPCSSPVSVNQGRALPPIPVDHVTGMGNSGSVRSCNSRSHPKTPLETKLSPNYCNRELPNIPSESNQVSYRLDLVTIVSERGCSLHNFYIALLHCSCLHVVSFTLHSGNYFSQIRSKGTNI